ncbi:hypothetical protein FS837_010749 [Tulasnella sp. UAMH 9824]|nr:hypothetical protein FS837_010749 [Tulasnella sp. UAMH 9824]
MSNRPRDSKGHFTTPEQEEPPQNPEQQEELQVNAAITQNEESDGDSEPETTRKEPVPAYGGYGTYGATSSQPFPSRDSARPAEKPNFTSGVTTSSHLRSHAPAFPHHAESSFEQLVSIVHAKGPTTPRRITA